ncbi:hypothetical protein KM043_011624 [Ampulex compressa]|nr:hypothetical protein KM043_011624 [Ampulex compressa]
MQGSTHRTKGLKTPVCQNGFLELEHPETLCDPSITLVRAEGEERRQKERDRKVAPHQEVIPTVLSLLSPVFPPRAADERVRGRAEERSRVSSGGTGRGEARGESEGASCRPPSPLFSISDKNKVNGEWGCRMGGCAATLWPRRGG